MKVILLSDVKGVGRRHEEKEVSDGHARNFLIPHKLAVPAGEGAAAEVKAQKEREVQARLNTEKALEESASKISGTEISIKEKANASGHLFSGISAQKLSDILRTEKNLNIGAGNILLKAPIKETGSHEIGIKVGDKVAHFILNVEAK